MKSNPFLERQADEEDEFGNVIEGGGEDDEEDWMDDEDAIKNDPLLQQFLSDEKASQLKRTVQQTILMLYSQ